MPNLDISISAKHGTGIEELKSALVRMIGLDNEKLNSGMMITNQRHYQELGNALIYLDRAETALQSGLSGELAAQDLRMASDCIGNITGKITPDDILGSIFSKFCIGK